MEVFSRIAPWLLLMLAISAVLLPGLPQANCDENSIDFDDADVDDCWPKPAPGLSYKFYKKSCPKAEAIVRKLMKEFLTPNVSQAAGVIRLFFHDCFVQGCDGSVLINATNGEQFGIPNLTLRASALAIVNEIKDELEEVCPNTVSCADTLALAAREAVKRAHGKYIPVPLGRRDSLNYSNASVVLQNLPAPFFNLTQLLSSFNSKGLDTADLVALSGAHTVGLAHCSSFSNRLRPTVDPLLNSEFAEDLLETCPNSSVNVAINMDIRTPHKFDNKYYLGALKGEVLFDSDAALLSDKTTKAMVKDFASENHEFLKQFGISFVKMSMIQVLTGNAEGNIRKVCSVLNSHAAAATTTTTTTSTTSSIHEDNVSSLTNTFIAKEVDMVSNYASM